ncbi:MAG: helix-turn-helix transcriptional regulator [Lachnospiraceae bacterium]|nr:helix-turn-helix transcriptional regulator [Lachnospiraceae bacterium]
MDFSEKILTLRKGNDWTQEELAEKLGVSRQSVSKWESGQAVPEMQKIVALSSVFNVTTDYLLKPDGIDELSVKTDILEKQQQKILLREKQRNNTIRCAMYAVSVYLLFFAVYFIGHYMAFDFGFGNPSIIFAEFLIATAIVIFICVRNFNKNN